MKLKLFIIITVLAIIGVAVIAVVKKPEQTPATPDIVETEMPVETEPEVNLDSLGGKDEKIIVKDPAPISIVLEREFLDLVLAACPPDNKKVIKEKFDKKCAKEKFKILLALEKSCPSGDRACIIAGFK